MDATPIRSYSDLLSLLRARRDELGISCETLDRLAGLSSGHAGRLLCGVKRAGITLYWPLLESLGLRCLIEVDPDAVARLAHRWHRRNEAHVRHRPARAADAFDACTYVG